MAEVATLKGTARAMSASYFDKELEESGSVNNGTLELKPKHDKGTQDSDRMLQSQRHVCCQ